MGYQPKIEIYRIVLKRKDGRRPVSFREFFRAKSNHYAAVKPTPSTNAEIFNIYYEDFLKEIGKVKYKTDNKSQKGFTVAVDVVDGKDKTLVNISSGRMFLDGILEGGKFGKQRYLGEIDDIRRKAKIHRHNIVSDRFYFLLYTPLDHSDGFLIIQGYTDSKISDIFKKHLKDYFKYHQDWSSEFEIFIPEKYRTEYMEKAGFRTVTFSSKWIINENNFEEITGKKRHDLTVKVEITDKSEKPADVSKIRKIIEWFGKSRLEINNSGEKKLEDFDKLNAKMESNGKALAFNFDDEQDIVPSILLDSEQYIDSNNVLKFELIEEFCRKLLQEITSETSPSSGITEL